MVLSFDLRQRIFAARESGKYSVREIAERYDVAKATVKKLLRLVRETGSLVPRKGGSPALAFWTDPNIHAIVRGLVADDNDATLEELCDRLNEKTGTRISVPQMCDLLKQLMLYRKKNSSRKRRRLRESRTSS